MSLITLERTLKGHNNSINCLAISADGNTLISGDDDARLLVWNLRTGEISQEISCAFNGQVSAVAWITFGEELDTEAFVFGCADGTLQIYNRTDPNSSFVYVHQTSGHDGAVEDIAFSKNHRRIASCGGGTFQVWKISASGVLDGLIASPPRKMFIARNIRFCDDGAGVLVFYLESHEIAYYSIEPWDQKWVKEIATRVGNACFCPDSESVFVSNLETGVDQYKFPTMERVQSFPHAVLRRVPLQVTTARKGAWLVSGGEDGYCRVFERSTGLLLERLQHGDAGTLVQTVTTHTKARTCLIVTGHSSPGSGVIKVWKHTENTTRDQPPVVPKPDTNWSAWQIVLLVFFTMIAMNLASVVYPSVANEAARLVHNF